MDTIDTLESGIPNAIKVFERLKQKGHDPMGIRLDSGDLAWLSIHASKMLDNAGFPNVKIVLSNQIDEMVLWQIISRIQEEASTCGVDPEALIERLIYGVGTRLITSRGKSALDGVYKLVALKNEEKWAPAIKISENREKIINPGNKRLLRIYDNSDIAVADMMCLSDEIFDSETGIRIRHPVDSKKYRDFSPGSVSKIEPLLHDVVKDGKIVYDFPSIELMREQRREDLNKLNTGVKRLINPHVYHVSLSTALWNLKERLIQEAR